MFKYERVKKIIKDLEEYKVDLKPVDQVWMKPGDFKTPKEADANGDYRLHNYDDLWHETRAWFKTELDLKDCHGDYIMRLETGKEGQWEAMNPQFLLFVDGEVFQGLDVNHRDVLMPSGKKVRLDFHGFVGMQGNPVYFRLKVGKINLELEQLIYDLKVPLEAAEVVEETEKTYLLKHLNHAINLLDLRTYPTEDSIKQARKYLEETVYSHEAVSELLYEKDLLPKVSCIGHTHIDVAWLWTLKQTREKSVRSFSTALKLMEAYDDYLFMASQPILLQFVKEAYPEVFEKILKRIKEGRFEVEGAMWLEADCNLSSGESLIRQILLGKKYMKENFDVDSKILWLPDVFGYTAALPQILKGMHIDHFVTSKISWNEYNKMPYDTFYWQGIDGSEIQTNFITKMDIDAFNSGDHRAKYEGDIAPHQIAGAWARYQQKDQNNHIMVSYGYGDGGGGPTKDMFEVGRRMSKWIPGVPKVKINSLTGYFSEMDFSKMNLPKWIGELYLEYHRGTLTTMAKSKKYNRYSENLYMHLELMNAIFEDKKTDLITRGWEMILLNQFHDIIPGSSIKEVYDESFEQYEKIIQEGHEEMTSYLENYRSGHQERLLAFNHTSSEKLQRVSVPEGISALKYESEVYPVQDQTCMVSLPSKGYKTFDMVKGQTDTQDIGQVETKFYSVSFDENGIITSLYDKLNDRQLTEGNFNELVLYEDRPHNYDAWDVNIYFEEKPYKVHELDHIKMKRGQVYDEVIIERSFLKSKIYQSIKFYHQHGRIDFDTEVDWQERHLLLKAGFETSILGKASYDIQFGHIERPIHRNTSWDEAKFEVCGHHYCDLAERNYGLALMSDCKYGYDIHEKTMRISLLRGATYPNPEADLGKHTFTYSIMPHKEMQEIISEGYLLNHKVETLVGNFDTKSESYFSLSNDQIVVETIKISEKGDGIIVRLYESLGECGQSTYKSAFEGDAYLMSLDETILEEASDFLTFKPFEIKTLFIKK